MHGCTAGLVNGEGACRPVGFMLAGWADVCNPNSLTVHCGGSQGGSSDRSVWCRVSLRTLEHSIFLHVEWHSQMTTCLSSQLSCLQTSGNAALQSTCHSDTAFLNIETLRSKHLSVMGGRSNTG